MWELAWGKHREVMHKRYAEADVSQIPDQLLNEPMLHEGLDIYYSAFWELNTDRQVGMGLGPIPYSSIRNYCKDRGLGGDQSDNMMRLLRKMDSEFIKFQEKQAKKARKIKGK